MSMRTLVEINHDYSDRAASLEMLSFLARYLASGSRDDAERLERYGIKVVGLRHHSELYVIDGRADGFPPRYLTPPPHAHGLADGERSETTELKDRTPTIDGGEG